jgi:hypothetical protein
VSDEPSGHEELLMHERGIGSGWLAATLVVAACTGTVDGGAADTPAPGSAAVGMASMERTGGAVASPAARPGIAAAAPARIRRLNEKEVRNTIADVFGMRTLGDVHFPVETQQGAFDNRYEDLTFNQDFADALQAAAELTGSWVGAHLAELVPCDSAKVGEATCAGQLVDGLGLRAFRRPLRADERDRLLALFRKTRVVEDFPTSVATAVEAMVQSPAFVFRTELGEATGARVPLAPHEIASALSYLLVRSAPDQKLLDAAASGALARPEEIAAQARRLLGDGRTRDMLHDFFLEWLDMTTATQMSKSDPAFSSKVAQSMVAETLQFVDDVWSRTSGYSTLLTSASSFVDARLAPLYGVPAPAGAALVPVALDPGQRAGFLTQPGFIGSHTPGAARSPIGLGHFVRTKMLCQALPPPPPGVPPVPTDATLDVVARYSRHEQDPSCAGCHAQLDAIGFGYSQYDVLGRFAPMDHGVTEDGAGRLSGTDVDGPFHGPVELARKLTASAEARRCFGATALAFALGRDTVGQAAKPIDAPAIAALIETAFRAGDLKDLFVGITTSEAFLLRDTTALAPGGK